MRKEKLPDDVYWRQNKSGDMTWWEIYRDYGRKTALLATGMKLSEAKKKALYVLDLEKCGIIKRRFV